MSSQTYSQTPIPTERMEEYRTTIEQCVVEAFDSLKSSDFIEALLLYDRTEKPELVSIKPSDVLTASINRELTEREIDSIFDRLGSYEPECINVESFIEAEKRRILAMEFYDFAVSDGEITIKKFQSGTMLFENVLSREGVVLIFCENKNLVRNFISYVHENYSEEEIIYDPNEKSIEFNDLKLFFVGSAAREAFDYSEIPDLVPEENEEREEISSAVDETTDQRGKNIEVVNRIGDISVGPYLRSGEGEAADSERGDRKKRDTIPDLSVPEYFLQEPLQGMGGEEMDEEEIATAELDVREEESVDQDLCAYILELLNK